VDRLVAAGDLAAGDLVWGGDAREGGLLLLVPIWEGAVEASFRRFAAGGFTEVGEGVGRVFAAEGVFATTTVEFCTATVVVAAAAACFPDPDLL